MFSKELFHMALGAIIAQRMRSILTALGIAVGVAAVVLLTSIGEGVHKYVVSEFTQFGTHIIGINPGKAQTMGGAMGVFGTTRPLTMEDAEALRRIPSVTGVISMVQVNAQVEAANRARRTTVYGVGSNFPEIFKMKTSMGRFLPEDNPRSPRNYVVLGAKVKADLFANENPLGQRLRVGGGRYRVIGVMESKGNILGVDMDDCVFIPTIKGLELLNREGLQEIDVVYRETASLAQITEAIKRVLIARHGKEDFTITTQEQVLDTMGSILDVLTFSVAALGSISLFVGGIGILTILTISVNERISEIGLLRAVGAGRSQILVLFLTEAVVLAAMGGVAGLVIGIGGAMLLAWLVPDLPVHISWLYVLMAEGVAVLIGIIAGVVPALRAASLDPVEALRAE